jgi:hypothetical protein
MLYGQIRRRSIDYSTPKFDGKVKKVQFLRCASFRVHCGVHKYASFHEIRDAFLSRWCYAGELKLFTLPSQF